MAMASATILSFNRTTLRPNTPSLSTPIRFPGANGISLTHFVKHFEGTLNLSSSHSISPSLLQPVALQKSNSAPFNRSRSSPFTVYAAKGYKMKTHKASAKRFRVTGTGKIVRRRAGKQHLLAKKNTKRKLRLSKMIQVDRRDYNNVIGALPYLKVNRKA